MNYRDFYKNKQVTEKDFNGLIPEGITLPEFQRATVLENRQLNDIFIASRIASRNLKKDPNHYRKLYEDYEQENCYGEDGSDIELDIDTDNDYDENGGLPKVGGALAVPHFGQPIMMGKIIQVGNEFGKGSATGELGGMTSANSKGVAKDSGGLPVRQDGDTEPITAGGKNIDSSLASKTVGGSVVPGEGQKQGGKNSQGTIASTSKLSENKQRILKATKEVLKEIRYNKSTGKWEKINENTVNMKMGPSYKKVQPVMYQDSEDDWARTNQYEPEITEMYDDEEECMMNERYVELANSKRNLSESELSELKTLREKIDSISEKNWIQKAIKHPGRCAHPGDSNCPKGSPQYNLAMRFKKGDIHRDNMEKDENFKKSFEPHFGPDWAEEEEEGKVEEGDKKWIQKAVNPKHKGYCTPMTKATCTPHRKALAKRFKHHDIEESAGCCEEGNCGECACCEKKNMQENTVDMKMGPSYKTVQPRMYQTSEDDWARTNEYDPQIQEAGIGAVQHSSYRTVDHGNLPQNPKQRWEDDIDEGSISKVSKTIAKGQKSKSSMKKQNLKHQKPKKTTTGVHKRNT